MDNPFLEESSDREDQHEPSDPQFYKLQYFGSMSSHKENFAIFGLLYLLYTSCLLLFGSLGLFFPSISFTILVLQRKNNNIKSSFFLNLKSYPYSVCAYLPSSYDKTASGYLNSLDIKSSVDTR